MTDADATEQQKVTTSSRDQVRLRADLQGWLETRLGPGARPEITSFESPESNGMSSETVLFSASWDDDDGRDEHRLVMRLAPSADSFPVFPRYDLTRQFDTMRLIALHTDIPVPDVLWNEPDPEPMGAPFFVMRRIDGIVPPDVMPYTFGSWLTEATDEQRDTLMLSTLDVLVKLTRIPDPTMSFAVLRPSSSNALSPLRRHFEESRAWLDWSVGDEPSPLLDRCFAWLEAHWPSSEGRTVVSWGDARIGNVMYQDFRPVAVLDWEMAALGPAELDVSWFIYLHRFFDDLAVQFDLPPMPSEFMNRARVESAYAAASGRTPRDMDWYLMYAATRHGIVFTRTSRRAAHFGDAPMPDDPDDAIMHRATLEAMLEGTYWDAH